MRIAAMGWTKPDAGVIATSPATAPEMAPRTLGFPVTHHSTNSQDMAAAAAPKCVATKALVASGPALSALPALKPNHPTHNMEAPITLRTRLWGRIDSCGYPVRLPIYSAHTSAETPEVMWTTVPPAKSHAGNRAPCVAFSKPPLPHTMCAMGKYTRNIHSVMNSSMAENRMRSAKAPQISAGVMRSEEH